LTDLEIAMVKDALTRTRDKTLFILAVGLKTGLRISELLSLKVGDVYQYGRLADVVYVERKHMKQKLEGRAIPLHQDAKVALSVWVLASLSMYPLVGLVHQISRKFACRNYSD
jgi:integrase